MKVRDFIDQKHFSNYLLYATKDSREVKSTKRQETLATLSKSSSCYWK